MAFGGTLLEPRPEALAVCRQGAETETHFEARAGFGVDELHFARKPRLELVGTDHVHHGNVDATRLEPHVTWGTNPGQVAPITGRVPVPRSDTDERALRYMDLQPGVAFADISVDRVFIGSCTNARIEDLRAAAQVVEGRRAHPSVRAMVVPGSTSVKRAAEDEGLDLVFKAAGFEWRNAGCSMCLGMNPDILAPGERCASTSNRNFEGRQGSGGRTHLMSPPMAAAAAITGHLVDVRELM